MRVTVGPPRRRGSAVRSTCGSGLNPRYAVRALDRQLRHRPPHPSRARDRGERDDPRDRGGRRGGHGPRRHGLRRDEGPHRPHDAHPRPGARRRHRRSGCARSRASRSAASPTARSSCTSGASCPVESKVPIRTRDDLSHDLHAGRGAGLRWPSPRSRRTPGASRSSATPSPSSPTARRCSDSATSGPLAALPVMEGKAALFKRFADIDAFPICLDTTDIEEIIRTVKAISPVFAGINLEDISAPRCFEIEARLREELDIPVFHDDQHGTAIVALAALRNALRVVGKRLEDVRLVMSGAGAAGTAILKLFLHAGARHVVVADVDGVVHRQRADVLSGDHPNHAWIAENTNPEGVTGTLSDAMRGADVFLGVSAPNILTEADIASMAPDSVVFAMANPVPEIDPDVAARHAAVVATGRSDFANQINNVLVFPGVFRGLIDSGRLARDDRRAPRRRRRAGRRRPRGRAQRDLHHPERLPPGRQHASSPRRSRRRCAARQRHDARSTARDGAAWRSQSAVPPAGRAVLWALLGSAVAVQLVVLYAPPRPRGRDRSRTPTRWCTCWCSSCRWPSRCSRVRLAGSSSRSSGRTPLVSEVVQGSAAAARGPGTPLDARRRPRRRRARGRGSAVSSCDVELCRLTPDIAAPGRVAAASVVSCTPGGVGAAGPADVGPLVDSILHRGARTHGRVRQWSQSVTPPHPARCAGDTPASNRPHGPSARRPCARTTVSEARLAPPLSPSARRRVCLRPTR